MAGAKQDILNLTVPKAWPWIKRLQEPISAAVVQTYRYVDVHGRRQEMDFGWQWESTCSLHGRRPRTNSAKGKG